MIRIAGTLLMLTAAGIAAAEDGGCSAAAQAHAPTAYACEAIAIVERFGVAVEQVDWPAIKARALGAARESSAVRDVHAIVADALRALDPHSRLSSPRGSAELDKPQVRMDRVQPNSSTRIAYVEVRGFAGTHSESMQRYVFTLREGLAAAESDGTCGYIVDLRRNPGGNMWPALLGLQPLLGDGIVGAFRTRDGTLSRWRLDAAHASIEWTAVVESAQAPAASSAAGKPVAVLLGTETASAGEAIAIAFRDRAGTRSFGWHTAGLTTANAGFHLSDDATLYVAVAQMTDRRGNDYLPYLRPDEETVAALRVHKTGRYEDVTRKAAAVWLAGVAGCRKADASAQAAQ